MIDASPIDPAVIEGLERVGGTKLVRGMTGLFLEGVPARVTELRSASESGDLGAVEYAAHSLKSSAGNLGAMRLYALCQEAESAAAARDSASVAALLAELEQACTAATEALAGIASQLPPG